MKSFSVSSEWPGLSAYVGYTDAFRHTFCSHRSSRKSSFKERSSREISSMSCLALVHHIDLLVRQSSSDVAVPPRATRSSTTGTAYSLWRLCPISIKLQNLTVSACGASRLAGKLSLDFIVENLVTCGEAGDLLTTSTQGVALTGFWRRLAFCLESTAPRSRSTFFRALAQHFAVRDPGIDRSAGTRRSSRFLRRVGGSELTSYSDHRPRLMLGFAASCHRLAHSYDTRSSARFI